MSRAIFTHDEAAEIVELFEDVLERYNITVPSPEDDERELENTARLYGTTYWELLDDVEFNLIHMLDRHSYDTHVVTNVFS